MAKNSSRSTGNSKPANTSADTTAEPKAMDPDLQESSLSTDAALVIARHCYSIDTLVSEVLGLFPETIVTYGDPNGRDVALSATFETEESGFGPLREILSIVGLGERIAMVSTDLVGGRITVFVRNTPATYDSREQFGLAEAFAVLIEDQEGSL